MSADFDANYEPITASYPTTSPGTYTVQSGDTLQSIAAAQWGDPAMWYLIADANGLTGSEPLVPDQVLIIPNKLANIHNNSGTFRVFDAALTMGNTDPTLPPLPAPPPPPRSKKHCGGIGKILIAVVAIVAAVYTAGAALAVLGPGAAAGGSVLSTMAAGGMTAISSIGGLAGMMGAAGFGFATIAAGAIGAAVGSIVSQGLGVATGMQDKFSWKAVGVAAIGGAVSAGINTSGFGAVFGGTVPNAMAQAAIGSAVTQGLSVATGLQEKFSWTQVAISAGAVAASYAASELLKNAKFGLGDIGNRIARNTLSSTAVGGLSQFAGGQRPDWSAVAMDSFGSSLGNELTTRQVEGDALKSGTEAKSTGTAPDMESLVDVGQMDARAKAMLDQIVKDTPIPSLNIAEDVPEAERLAEQRQAIFDDSEKAAVYTKAKEQKGLSDADAMTVAGHVDTRRYVDNLNAELACVSPSNPSYADKMATVTVLTNALINKEVYFNQGVSELLPQGVSRLSGEHLKKLTGYTDEDFAGPSGYFGALYENTNTSDRTGTYIYANRGTDDGPDWVNNFKQQTGFQSEQFNKAAEIGYTLNVKLKGNISFTGHSLGGGLAALQALHTGRTAITFNAEGLNNATVDRFQLNMSQAEGSIAAFNVRGEPLSGFQDSVLTKTVALSTTPIRNAIAMGGAAGDLLAGKGVDRSSFGIGNVASAAGARVVMPAYDLKSQPLGFSGRLTNTVNLHFMDYVLSSVKNSLQPSGVLPANYLKNVYYR